METKMKLEAVKDRVDGIPYMSFVQAKEMTTLILENKLQSILELGFCHGVSTCYMAGALDEIGGGSIITIDLLRARSLEPNIETLLSDLGLSRFVTPFFEPTSYIWRLMKMMEADPTPRFDLCYIDGAHNWATTGFAFFLVDRLLKPGGWMIFDDLNWTYESSPALRNTEMVKKMPADERNTPQVQKVYDLLVLPHPSYEKFSIKGPWGYAQKKMWD
jgi:predicted O-methyltransferase YrrM